MQRFGALRASVVQAPYKNFVRKAPDPYKKSRLVSACIQLYSSRYKIFQVHGLSPTVQLGRRRTPAHCDCLKKEFQIKLDGVVEADLELFCVRDFFWKTATAVFAKTSHANCRTTLTNRPSRGRRGRFLRVVQQSACEVLERTAV